ncbi:hypothetical protein [Herbaspirillum sp. YR522]|uniref:hypothetical protein n=1 Tax=Herbaspirillum sp. YR522 TaxID=1144342 RepID=UPI00026F7643|nr:hypothetical protein [Herbaspirillum sp. YR522]EJN09393.1 hypothetical protein PMI40_00841 [Herbaspirillum sp. YR522]
MIDLILKVWPYLLAAGGAVLAIIFKQSAEKTKAQAKQEVAEVKKQDAEKQAAAAQSGAAAAKERTDVESTIAVAPAGDSAGKLRDNWSRD